MRKSVAAACVLLFGSVHAAEGVAPGGEPAATGFACTAETLRVASPCVFEGDAGLAPPEETAARSRVALSEQACAAAARPPGEARPDSVVKAVCEAEVLRSLTRCAEDGAFVVDREGRFLPSARACYAAIGAAVARAHTAAAVMAPCCRCLAESRCEGADRCLEATPGTKLSGPTAVCAARACSESCGASLPLEDADDEDGRAEARDRKAAPLPMRI